MPTSAPNFHKNIVYGTILAGGNVHIGDIIYNIADDFQHSILFLKIEKRADAQYALQLAIKSKHAKTGPLAVSGENLLREAVKVAIPPELFAALAEFQTFRRSVGGEMRLTTQRNHNPSSVIAAEGTLSKWMHQTFFTGEIGQVCADFIGLLREQRIEELLLAIAGEDDAIINLPFEMALPHLFPADLGAGANYLATAHFGLVRTKTPSLGRFEMQGKAGNAAPLKMLFITALPENLGEGSKMLQIEEEQTRLIRAIGALEATGDKKPKIVIEFLENASLAELDKALTARHHDMVHISGHGGFNPNDKKGVLYFENEEGDEAKITGAQLGKVLEKHGCVKLLVLSACETAIAGAEGGVVEQAAEYGVPTIVAMRFAVTDEGAKVFTTALYTHLAKGDSVTQAVAYAREALHDWVASRRQNAPNSIHIAEWFTPVVYQNQYVAGLIDAREPYLLPDNFYPQSSFLKTRQSRLIGEGFIGRKGYLIRMRQAFRAGKHVTLQGLGGLGKTTLAEAFAHNYDNHSHEVVIFRNAHQINEKHILDHLNKRFAKTNPDLAAQVQEILERPQATPTDKLQVLIDNYLCHRRIILIFDNFEDVQQTEGGELQRAIGSAALSEFMRHLGENTPPDCHLIFTTRYAIPDLADTVTTISLGKMGYAEQYRLLNYADTLRGIPLADRDAVYKRLDGHPRGYEFLEALVKKDKTFTWAQVDKVETDVFENLLLEKVYERLGDEEQHLFQVAAVFIAATPVAAIAHVLEKDEAAVKTALQGLGDWSLLFLDAKSGTFDVHRLTRTWMSQNVTPAEKIKEWALAAGNYFKAQPTWDDHELAKDYYEIAEAWTDFAEVSFRLQDHYQLIGFYQRAFELNQAVLAKNIDAKTNALALNNNGMMLHRVGQYDAALPCFEQSLVIDQEIGDRQGEGATLNNISQIYDAKGDYDTALRYLEQSLGIQQEIGDIAGLATTLNNMGDIYLNQQNDIESAVKAFLQSYQIFQQIGSPNSKVPESYLSHIKERIGAVKYQEIISNIKQ